MTSRPMDEVLTDFNTAMGQELGSSFFALHRKLVELHVLWQQYRQLYGSDPETVLLLNRTAGLFFKVVQDELWDSVLLGISRMTDSQSTGKRRNLTLQSLPSLISDSILRSEIEKLCDKARTEASFAREHRNRRIAHQDHDYLSDSCANPLSGISRKRVESMLAALRAVMNRVNLHFFDSTTMYETFVDEAGARLLVHKLGKLERLVVVADAP